MSPWDPGQLAYLLGGGLQPGGEGLGLLQVPPDLRHVAEGGELLQLLGVALQLLLEALPSQLPRRAREFRRVRGTGQRRGQ